MSITGNHLKADNVQNFSLAALVECLEALHHVVVENDLSTFEEMFMGAMRTHNPRMTPKVHVHVHHVPEYVRRTAAPLGPTSEQALESQHRFFDMLQTDHLIPARRLE